MMRRCIFGLETDRPSGLYSDNCHPRMSFTLRRRSLPMGWDGNGALPRGSCATAIPPQSGTHHATDLTAFSSLAAAGALLDSGVSSALGSATSGRCNNSFQARKSGAASLLGLRHS